MTFLLAAALLMFPSPYHPPPKPHYFQEASRGSGLVAMPVEVTCYVLRGTTYTGTQAGPGSVAVDPRVIPLGSRLFVPGYGDGMAVDTGKDIVGSHIDIWISDEQTCLNWGVKRAWVTVER